MPNWYLYIWNADPTSATNVEATVIGFADQAAAQAAAKAVTALAPQATRTVVFPSATIS